METNKQTEEVDSPEPQAVEEKESIKGNGNVADNTLPEGSTNEWDKQLEEVTRQRENYRDLYLRARAELDNYKKRLPKEREDIRFYVITALFSPFITALENFSLGLKNAEKRNVEREVLEGFKMVFQQFNLCFKDLSIKPIDPTGEVFNPHLHEAVSVRHDAEKKEGTVLEVVRTGYRVGDHILRPAIVTVSKGPEVPKIETMEALPPSNGSNFIDSIDGARQEKDLPV
ncbi:MAG: nucleotide exchange factor GrpE [Puniceicoccales bacterium]|jgi:molecular chaperone GrpE|nr:nucleotide exchange factor GrpE [Puniceicoccales bacterium]